MRISKPWKCFLHPDSRKESVYWSENQTFSYFYEKIVNDGLRRKIQNFHIFASIQNTHFSESGAGTHFQASGMRAIDSPHEITPKNMILREKFKKFSIFTSIHTSIFLNQGQGSIFTLRECAQSIFRMILPLIGWFSENFKRNFLPTSFTVANV